MRNKISLKILGENDYIDTPHFIVLFNCSSLLISDFEIVKDSSLKDFLAPLLYCVDKNSFANFKCSCHDWDTQSYDLTGIDLDQPFLIINKLGSSCKIQTQGLDKFSFQGFSYYQIRCDFKLFGFDDTISILNRVPNNIRIEFCVGFGMKEGQEAKLADLISLLKEKTLFILAIKSSISNDIFDSICDIIQNSEDLTELSLSLRPTSSQYCQDFVKILNCMGKNPNLNRLNLDILKGTSRRELYSHINEFKKYQPFKVISIPTREH